MSTSALPTNPSPIPYGRTNETSTLDHRKYNVFVDETIANPNPTGNGRPVLIYALLSGFGTSNYTSALSFCDSSVDCILWRMYTEGWVVVSPGLTGTEPGIPGSGTWQDQEEVTSDWEDPSIFCGEFDAMCVIQHVISNISTYGGDPNNIFVGGKSGSTQALGYSTLGKDRTYSSADPNSSVPLNIKGFIGNQLVTTWWAVYDVNINGQHWKDKNDPTSLATGIGDVSQIDLTRSSMYNWCFTTTEGKAKVATVPIYFFNGGAVESTDFSKQGGADYGRPTITPYTINANHPSWHMHMAQRYLKFIDTDFSVTTHTTKSKYAVGTSEALGEDYELFIDSPAEAIEDQKIWLNGLAIAVTAPDASPNPVAIIENPVSMVQCPLIGRTANQILRKVLEATNQDEVYYQNIYKEILRGLKNKFSNIRIIDGEENFVEIRCITANPERPVAKQVQEDNLILPIISVSTGHTEQDESRQRYKPMLLWDSVWHQTEQRAYRVFSLVPKAVNLTYEVYTWGRYLEDIDQLAGQINLFFNPDLELDLPLGTIKFFLTDQLDDMELDVPDREDRLLRKTYVIQAQTYIPNPQYLLTSTGQIEKFYAEVTIAGEIIE